MNNGSLNSKDGVTGSAETASVWDILDGWKRSPTDLFSNSHHSLQRLLLWDPGAAKPDGGTAGQHDLDSDTVESGEDGRAKVCSPHPGAGRTDTAESV